jgi:hypothetical protein
MKPGVLCCENRLQQPGTHIFEKDDLAVFSLRPMQGRQEFRFEDNPASGFVGPAMNGNQLPVPEFKPSPPHAEPGAWSFERTQTNFQNLPGFAILSRPCRLFPDRTVPAAVQPPDQCVQIRFFTSTQGKGSGVDTGRKVPEATFKPACDFHVKVEPDYRGKNRNHGQNGRNMPKTFQEAPLAAATFSWSAPTTFFSQHCSRRTYRARAGFPTAPGPGSPLKANLQDPVQPLSASFSGLPALKAGARVAGISIGSPV